MPELNLPTPGVTTGPGWASQLNEAIESVNSAVDTTTEVIETGRLSETELSAKIDEQVVEVGDSRFATIQGGVPGPRVIFDGDSITWGNTTANPEASTQNHDAAWPAEMVRRSSGRMIYTWNTGVPGKRLDQRLAAFEADVLSRDADTTVLSIGTNDISQGRTLAAFMADLEVYFQKNVASGRYLILGAIYPKNVTVTTITAWNRAIRDWARVRRVPVIAFWELGDPTTGAWPSGWSTDGTHPDSQGPAIAAIGAFAWNAVATVFGGPAIPTPQYSSDGLFANALLTTLNAANTAVVTCTLAATTGTLAAGTYEYRVVAATYYGKNNLPDTKSVTLDSAGGVTVTRATSGGYQRWMVYRKAPGETAFRYMASLTSGTATWTDDGSVTPTDLWADGDFSQTPAGLLTGGGDWHRNAVAPVRAGATEGIHGNILRLEASTDGSAWNDYFEVTGLTPGQVIDFSAKLRAGASTSGRVALYLRWRSASAQISATIIHRAPGEATWGALYQRVTVPSGADRVRISIEGDAGVPWVEVAEIYLAPTP